MSIQGVCIECRRTVHLGDGGEPFCPVCGSRVFGPEIERARLERIGENEASFRTLNERNAEQQPGESLHLTCECGDPECSATFDIDASSYEAVRRHQARFVVLPSHVIADAEGIVDEGSGYTVVQKHGEARRSAESGQQNT